MSNGYHPDFRNQCVFLTILNADNIAWTADRRSFIGRDGSLNEPAAMKRGLNQRVGAALDPCLAMQGAIAIQPGETEEQALLHADKALYRAKAGGRNRIEFSG